MSFLRVRRLATAAAMLLGMPLHAARAQSLSESLGAALHGPAERVFLVTVDPGTMVWERFGHSAIIIHDPARGFQTAYNWGLFDFRTPGFLTRFILGRPRYLMGGENADEMLAFYQQTGRRMTIQEIDLTDAQIVALERLLTWNARPDHASYLYDYFRDNCSTRVRDAFDQVLDGRLRRAAQAQTTDITYRSESRRLLAPAPWAALGVTMVFGRPADRPLTEWEAMFIPMRLRDALRTLDIRASSGAPLVRQSWDVTTPGGLTTPDYRIAPDVLITVALSALMLLVVLGARQARAHDRHGLQRAALAIIACWTLVVGLAGLVVAFGWLFTQHVFIRNNENLLLVNPLALWLAGTLFWLTASPSRRALTAAVRAGAVLSACALVAVGLYVIPWTHQANGEIMVLVAPTTLATAALVASWRRADAGASVAEPEAVQQTAD